MPVLKTLEAPKLWKHLAILPGLTEILGPIRAEKVARSIVRAAMNQPLSRFLCGLSIPGVGVQTAKDLARYFWHMDFLYVASQEELAQVPGVGTKTARDIWTWFNTPANIKELNRMRELHVHYGSRNFEEPRESVARELSGQTFCVTGTFTQPRHEIIKYYEAKGAIYKSSISAGLDFVLVGEGAGSKKEKAEKLGLKILLEPGRQFSDEQIDAAVQAITQRKD